MTRESPDPTSLSPIVQAAMRWSGWGSPVGISILLVAVGVLFIALGIFLVCLQRAGLLP